MKNQPDYYLVITGHYLQFLLREVKDGLPSYRKVAEVRAAGHAAAIYEATRKKKLKFHA